MALGSCYTCIKYLMFAFNFIFWLLGCAILGVGIWLRVDEESAKIIHQAPDVDMLYSLAYGLMAIGFLIMLIGFLGCCGAIRESQCMLAVFFMFLFIIFATLLGFGIWAAVAKESFQDLTKDWLKEATESYYTNDQSRQFMDTVQTEFDCCGYTVAGALDFDTSYTLSDPPCPGVSTIAVQPCTEPFYEFLQSKLIVVAGVAIGIAIVMILGMVFSMVLCCAIRDVSA